MNKRSLLGLAVFTVAISGLAIVLYRCRYFANDDVQRFYNVGTMAVGVIGLAVLVLYTLETWKLRLTAEQQSEASIKPLIRLDFSGNNYKSLNQFSGYVFQLLNVGVAPALNVAVQRIVSGELIIDVEKESLIEPKQSVYCRYGTNENSGGTLPGEERRLDWLEFYVSNFPDSLPVTVEYESLSGKRYRTRHDIVTDHRDQTVRTVFRSIEEIG